MPVGHSAAHFAARAVSVKGSGFPAHGARDEAARDQSLRLDIDEFRQRQIAGERYRFGGAGFLADAAVHTRRWNENEREACLITLEAQCTRGAEFGAQAAGGAVRFFHLHARQIERHALRLTQLPDRAQQPGALGWHVTRQALINRFPVSAERRDGWPHLIGVVGLRRTGAGLNQRASEHLEERTSIARWVGTVEHRAA